MRAARLLGLSVLLLCLAPVPSAQAHQLVVAHTRARATTSIFDYGYHGLFSGAFVGLGGGYLVGRRDGWSKSDWRAVGLGISIGALAGAGLGLSLGLVERAGSRSAGYIARDLSAGASFGALIGAISGGVSAALKREPEHVLFGAAIGVVAGAGLGIIVGAIEGSVQNRAAPTLVRARRLRPDLASARAVDGSLLWLPSLSGRF